MWQLYARVYFSFANFQTKPLEYFTDIRVLLRDGLFGHDNLDSLQT